MAVPPLTAQRFSSAVGEDAVRFGDGILIAPALGKPGGEGDAAVTVRTGELVHVPEQAPGMVEALADTTMVCVCVPTH
jgi:hypothetical protein